MAIDAIADALWRRAPSIYRAARPLWRLVMRLLGRPTYAGYWKRRREFNYYAEAVRLARAHAPSGRSVLDVGANETAVISELDWFERRVVLDRVYVAPRPGVETVTIDFMRYQPPATFDLVLCLQVLEHVTDPAAFAKKLLATGRTVIVSVPHAWPAGLVADHLHDPIDEHRLRSWTGREPAEVSVVEDLGKERLLAVYTASAMPALELSGPPQPAYRALRRRSRIESDDTRITNSRSTSNRKENTREFFHLPLLCHSKQLRKNESGHQGAERNGCRIIPITAVD